MVTVYISSPYTKGDQAVNVRNQMVTTDELMDKGYCAIAPLYTHFQHMFRPRGYEDWMKVDLELLGRADVVLRLPGESLGADREVEHADDLGIPVAYSMEDLESMDVRQRM